MYDKCGMVGWGGGHEPNIRHWWRSPALVAQCTGTGGAVCKGATPSVEVVGSSPGWDPCSIRK
jgi:hypothetical protein